MEWLGRIFQKIFGSANDRRHFDVQLIGGIVLHQGKIAEMVTGEGKTLVATLPPTSTPSRAAAFTSSRSTTTWPSATPSGWPGLQHSGPVGGLDPVEDVSAERKPIYGCDITYGTNNEFGFDYLRDNMKFGSRTRSRRTSTTRSSTRSTRSSSTRRGRR
jgi:preprotein translocase subunit SecA